MQKYVEYHQWYGKFTVRFELEAVGNDCSANRDDVKIVRVVEGLAVPVALQRAVRIVCRPTEQTV